MNSLKQTAALTILSLCCQLLAAQERDKANDTAVKWRTNFSAFLDVFYTYDFAEPPSDEKRQYFLVNYNRAKVPILNHGLVKFSANRGRFTSNIAMHAGTYVDDNYYQESEFLRYIFELNAGILLGKRKNTHLEGGIFESRMGFEFVGTEKNLALTRSIFADNLPYYQSGIRATFRLTERKELTLMAANGWQQIYIAQEGLLPALHTNFKYEKKDKLILNWSTFYGAVRDYYLGNFWRFFNNAYAHYRFSNRFSSVLGVDLGFQEARPWEKVKADAWYGACLVMQYKITPRLHTALRGEVYADTNSVIVTVPREVIRWEYPFHVRGISLNVDFLAFPNSKFRIEGRLFSSENPIFIDKRNPRWPWYGVPTNKNFAITGAIQVRLE